MIILLFKSGQQVYIHTGNKREKSSEDMFTFHKYFELLCGDPNHFSKGM